MRVYLDFDGVLLDTDAAVMKEYTGSYNSDERREFVKNYDWNKLMDDKLIINDSLTYVKDSIYDVCLLSKIGTLSEGQAKIKYLRSRNVTIDINMVPTGFNKCDVVSASGNILIDDKIVNLDAWHKAGGISIYFNKNNSDIDIHGDKNMMYYQISNLKCLLSDDLKKMS